MFNNTDKRYNQYSSYLKNKFGAKVYKITLDAGFSCPNRDGTVGTGGCAFCSTNGSGDFAEKCITSIANQMSRSLSIVLNLYIKLGCVEPFI